MIKKEGVLSKSRLLIQKTILFWLDLSRDRQQRFRAIFYPTPVVVLSRLCSSRAHKKNKKDSIVKEMTELALVAVVVLWPSQLVCVFRVTPVYHFHSMQLFLLLLYLHPKI
jgi:hypothetical protein